MKRLALNIVVILSMLGLAYSAVRPSIRYIHFEGNRHFSDGKLRSLMGTKKSTIFKKSYLYDDLLIYDIKRIIDFYYRRGFQDAILEDIRFEWRCDSSQVGITIILKEGTAVLIDSVIIIGVAGERFDEIRRRILVKEGERLDLQLIDRSISQVVRYYGDEGFLSATVAREIEQSGHSAVIIFNVSEGSRCYLNDIFISGNEKTKDWVIQRDMRLERGDLLTLKDIDSFRKRLYQRGIFRTVSITEAPTISDSSFNINVKVQEQYPGEFSVGIGYGSEERMRTSLQFGYINLYGRAAAIGLESKISYITRRVKLMHYAPYILKSGMFCNGSVLYSLDAEPNFNREKTEAIFRLGSFLTDFWRFELSYTYRKTTLLNLPSDLRELWQGGIVNQYGMEFTYDTRTSRIFTRGGNYLNIFFSISNPRGLERVDFMKLSGDYRFYESLSSRIVGALQVSSGSLLKLAVEEIPLEEKYFLGGINSLRGYSRNSLGPTTTLGTPQGGNFYYLLRAELRGFVYKPLYLKIFFDNGGLYSYLSQAKITGSYSSAGMGVGAMWGVWIGRLEYAWRLENRIKSGMVIFQIGQAF